MTDKEGTLRMQPSGRWAVCRGDQAPVELEAGALFRLAYAAGGLQVRRMEYIGGRYRVADVPLVEGAEAAIGIED